jgi:hypothetical protein
VLGRWFQLAMSVGTVVVGVLLALVFAAGTEMAPLGWLFAALGVVGTVTWLLVPQGGRRA